MIRKGALLLLKDLKYRIGFMSTKFNSSTNVSKEKWDLFAGVLVERLPVVTKTLNKLEQKYLNYLQQVEFENSLKSNHELQHEKDLKQAELIKKGQLEIDLDDASSKQTAQDLEDMYTEEVKQFNSGNRTTNDDFKSANRNLEDTLYLLVKHKLGSKSHFLLPQGSRLENESMRQAAERILTEKCGKTMNVRFYGNSPCGFYKYKYPSGITGDSIGAKIFFYRTTLVAGNVDQSVNKDFMWLEKSALETNLKYSAYSESVQKFLF